MHLFSFFYKHFSIKFHYHLTIQNKCTLSVHPATMNSFRIFGFFLDIGGNNIDAPKIHNDYSSIKIFIYKYWQHINKGKNKFMLYIFYKKE